MQTPRPDPGAQGTSLDTEEILEKNQEATEQVKKAADHLLIVNSVLQKEVAGNASAENIHQAAAQAGQIERRLNDAADLLDEVNEALEAQVDVKSEEPKS